MKFLLINPPLENLDPGWISAFPLGLAYIAKVILNNGHDVEILDIQLNKHGSEYVEKFIQNSKPNVVGITGLVTALNYIVWLAEIIKRYHPQVPLLMGGALATTAPKILLENTKIDIAIIDEGELTMAELIKVFESLENKEGFTTIKGIWYKDGEGKIRANPQGERIENLDSVNFPAWQLFDMKKYLNLPVPLLDLEWRKKKRWIFVSTSRGCPFNCNFCSRVFGRKTYLRSAENIVSEIKTLIDRYNIEHINFCDDLFMIDSGRVSRFCQLLSSLSKKISWNATARVDLINESLLEKMRKAGCISLCLGIESASQKILNKMGKNITPAMAEKAISLLKKVGVYPHCTFMIGMIGENKNTIKETVDFIKKTDIFPQGFSYTTPLPASILYEEVKKKGLIQNETEYLKKITGNFIDHFVINVSELTNVELINLKRKHESELRRNFVFRHPFWAIGRFWNHLTFYGPRETLRRLKRNLFSKV